MRLLTKTEYMDKLKDYLHALPLYEQEDILSDYDEHFEVGLSKGKTAEEIAKELGDPYDISRNYINFNNNIVKHTADNKNNGILIAILLLGFNLIVVLAPYLSIIGVLIGIYITGGSFVFSGIALLFSSRFNFITPISQPHILTSLGFGIGLGCLGLLTIILAVYLTKLFIDLTKKYIRWNLEIVNKGGF